MDLRVSVLQDERLLEIDQSTVLFGGHVLDMARAQDPGK